MNGADTKDINLQQEQTPEQSTAQAPEPCVHHLLEVNDLHCGYGRSKPVEIVHGVTFYVDSNEFVCIVGANGCGKTTTLKTVMGLLPAFGGTVRIQNRDLFAMKEKEKARHFAYIPQAHTPPFPFTVADVVILGRTPHVGQLHTLKDYDRVVAYQAMELLGISHLADKPYTNLSGGQQQLVLIARALTQQSDVLIMDEPTASLDFGNQYLVLSRVRMLSKMGKAVIMVTHDPDHALFCGDRVIVMKDGRIVQEGTPQECITSESMREIYHIDARVVDVSMDEDRTERVCVPML